ncbi:MAG TPA: CBS domain-containing protein [Burkholderiales bacterium]
MGTGAPLPQAAKMLSTTPVSLVIVCNADGTMAGVITETDIVRSLLATHASYEIGHLRDYIMGVGYR